MDESEIRKTFWGAAGEPVPQVDPSDLKAVWDVKQDVNKSHPAGGVVIGLEVFKAHCKPGANISAVTYRANMIWMLQHVSPELIDPLLQEKLDAVFLAAAEIPMEWIGENGRKGFPFDPDDFVRRVRAA